MRRPLLAAALALGLLAVPAPVLDRPASAQTEPTVLCDPDADGPSGEVPCLVVSGHGYGHGRGMGQYGSYGYAKDHGWTFEQITEHFYGGTSTGSADNAPLDVLLKSYGTGWTIGIVEDGTIVVDGGPTLTGSPTGGPHAVAVAWLGGDNWQVYEGDACTGSGGGAFVDRGPMTADQVVMHVADPAPDDRTELLAACYPTGHRYVRGSLVADNFLVSTDPTERQRTMSRVAVEDYLRSVVPAESPSSWGGDGTAPGMHALRSQAIAARSYALAGDSRWGNATTCDDIFCQVYRGFGFNAAGVFTPHEATNGDLAVAQTAGVVRRNGSGIARTEFSSSTGGYTAGGAFPAVVDDGDAVSSNPNHDWVAHIPVGDIESALAMGDFEQIVVLSRNGLGEDGGRVMRLRIEMADGAKEMTGDQFRSQFQKYGVKSDWFTIGGAAESGTFSDTEGNVHEANIEKIAAAGIAGGFPDGTFKPNDTVSRGQMATFVTNGYELPPADSPTFSDIAGTTHEASIRAVASAGVATGYPDGSYKPGNPLTRGQMAAFLARAEGLDLQGETAALCDVDGHQFEAEISAVVAAGIASGTADECFHPDDPVTRGQMATFLVNALDL